MMPRPPEQVPPPYSTIEELKFKWAADVKISETHEINKREIQDALFALAEKLSFAVFDGASGPPAGEIVARMARDEMAKAVLKLPDNLSLEETINSFMEIYAEAQKKILKAGKENKEWKGMATTATVIRVVRTPDGKKRAVIANAGDSRVCILRAGKRVLEEITRDNTVYNDIQTANGKTEQEILENQSRISNISDRSQLDPKEQRMLRQWGDMLSNGLGGDEISNFSAKPDIYTPEINEGDMVLIFTDGVGKKFTDMQIAQIILEEKEPKAIVKRLVHSPPYPDDTAGAAFTLLAA